jgi:hypothetical protein
MEIRWHNNPVVFSPEEPSPSMLAELAVWPAREWKWFNTSNNKWYDYDGGWVIQGAVPIDLAYEGGKMEITKLTIVGGMITEIEYEE